MEAVNKIIIIIIAAMLTASGVIFYEFANSFKLDLDLIDERAALAKSAHASQSNAEIIIKNFEEKIQCKLLPDKALIDCIKINTKTEHINSIRNQLPELMYAIIFCLGFLIILLASIHIPNHIIKALGDKRSTKT